MGRRAIVMRSGAMLAAVCAFGAAAASASADATAIDFESYAPGSVLGQQGWTGGGCGPIDQSVVLNSGYPGAPPSFATKSLRMSNATTTGCFNDTFSPGLVNEAGEPTALNGGMSGGTRQPMFVAQWTFASSTGGYQPGLNVQVSPDRGDGARMSYVGMRHDSGSLTIRFFDVQGTDGTPAPCLQCANFVQTDFTGYDPTKPHTIRLEMRFIPGPSNDVVRLFVDGVLVHTGGSWEDYYTMDTESSPSPALQKSRTVDSLLIRASGAANPSASGQGYLIDNLAYSSGPLAPYVATTLTADPVLLRVAPILRLRVPPALVAHLQAGSTPLAGKTITFTAVPFGTICTGVTDASGAAKCTIPPSLAPVLALLGLGYDASFAGDSTYLASSDHAGLIK